MNNKIRNKMELNKQFRQFGHKMTSGRETTIDVLSETDEHLSAEDIHIKVHSVNPKIGLTTVYRTLELLINMGMVSKFDFGDGRARYELAEGFKGAKHHHHLVCTGCGRIVDYSEFVKEEKTFFKRIELELSRKYDFRITNHLVQFYGLCKKCEGY
jgi:Fur family ferric uptake transcriptional regulator